MGGRAGGPFGGRSAFMLHSGRMAVPRLRPLAFGMLTGQASTSAPRAESSGISAAVLFATKAIVGAAGVIFLASVLERLFGKWGL